MLDSYISALCRYAERTGLLQPEDLVFARNALLEALQLDSFDEAAAPADSTWSLSPGWPWGRKR